MENKLRQIAIRQNNSITEIKTEFFLVIEKTVKFISVVRTNPYYLAKHLLENPCIFKASELKILVSGEIKLTRELEEQLYNNPKEIVFKNSKEVEALYRRKAESILFYKITQHTVGFGKKDFKIGIIVIVDKWKYNPMCNTFIVQIIKIVQRYEIRSR